MRSKAERNPFEAYGERSSSRPYALRLPDAIDLVLRQIAAEEHQILLDCALKRDTGRAAAVLGTHVNACVDHTLALGMLG